MPNLTKTVGSVSKSVFNIYRHGDNHQTQESLQKSNISASQDNRKPNFIFSKDMTNQHDIDINKIYTHIHSILNTPLAFDNTPRLFTTPEAHLEKRQSTLSSK